MKKLFLFLFVLILMFVIFFGAGYLVHVQWPDFKPYEMIDEWFEKRNTEYQSLLVDSFNDAFSLYIGDGQRASDTKRLIEMVETINQTESRPVTITLTGIKTVDEIEKNKTYNVTASTDEIGYINEIKIKDPTKVEVVPEPEENLEESGDFTNEEVNSEINSENTEEKANQEVAEVVEETKTETQISDYSASNSYNDLSSEPNTSNSKAMEANAKFVKYLGSNMQPASVKELLTIVGANNNDVKNNPIKLVGVTTASNVNSNHTYKLSASYDDQGFISVISIEQE